MGDDTNPDVGAGWRTIFWVFANWLAGQTVQQRLVVEQVLGVDAHQLRAAQDGHLIDGVGGQADRRQSVHVQDAL